MGKALPSFESAGERVVGGGISFCKDLDIVLILPSWGNSTHSWLGESNIYICPRASIYRQCIFP